MESAEEKNRNEDYSSIYLDVKKKFMKDFISAIDTDALFTRGAKMKITEDSFITPAKPEEYTSKYVTDLLNRLNIPNTKLIGQFRLKREKSMFYKRTRRYPDFVINKEGDFGKGLMIEIEPIGSELEKDIEKYRLNGKGKSNYSGIAQVLEWYDIFQGYSTKYDSIATNFVDWYLVSLDEDESQMKYVRISVEESMDFIYRVAMGTSSDYISEEYIRSHGKIEKFYKTFNERIGYVISNLKDESCSRRDIKVQNIPSISKTGLQLNLEDKINIAVSTYRTHFFRLLFIKILIEWKLIPFDPVQFIFNNKLVHTILFKSLFFEVFNRSKDGRTNIDEKFTSLPYLNGGLFRKTSFEEDYDVDLSSEVYKDIWGILKDYSFTKKEDGETHIDPKILGYIFERTLEATGERKDSGTYYTPDYITHYMTKRLIQMDIIDKLNPIIKRKKILNYSLEFYDEIETLDVQVRTEIYNEMITILKDITICDNACGSGAFLKSAGQELFNIYKEIYSFFNWKLEFRVLKSEKKGKRPFKDIYEIRKYILQKNIYGVDLLESAIEVCQLRLWLWLVEPPSDFSKKYIVDPLPNVDFNIVCGNSLIGYHDLLIGQALFSKKDDFINSIKDYYVEQESSLKDNDLRRHLHNIRNDTYLKCNEEFALKLEKFFKAKSLETIREKTQFLTRMKVFHWIVDFYPIFKNGGFDIIVGNPPYVRADREDAFHIDQRKILKELKQDYPSLFKKWDLFVAFIELSIRYLIKKDGKFAYIVSNALCTVEYSKKIRKYLVENCEINRIDFIDDFQVFKGIGVVPVILFAKRTKEISLTERIFRKDKFDNIIHSEYVSQNDVIFKKADLRVIEFDYADTIIMGDICYISKGMVLNSDHVNFRGEFNENDVISDFRTEIFNRPFIDGKDAKRFSIENIRFLEWGTERVPDRISRRTFDELYNGIKIIRGRMTDAVIERNNFSTSSSATVIKKFDLLKGVENKSISGSIKKFNMKEDNAKGKNNYSEKRTELEMNASLFSEEYLLCILNSSWANKYLNAIGRQRKNYFYPDDLKKLPIKKIRDQSLFIKIEHILEFLYVYDKENAKIIDDLLNFLVYELYFSNQFYKDRIYTEDTFQLADHIAEYLPDFDFRDWNDLYWRYKLEELNELELPRLNNMVRFISELINQFLVNVKEDEGMHDIIKSIKSHQWIQIIENQSNQFTVENNGEGEEEDEGEVDE